MLFPFWAIHSHFIMNATHLDDLESLKHEHLLYLCVCIPNKYTLHQLNHQDLFNPDTQKFSENAE